MKFWWWHLLLMSLFGCCLQAISQPSDEKFLKMETLTIHDGLSQGMVNCIYQDHFGFMWFGTMDGLNRYDGYHFILYRYETNDPNSISGNLITSIFEDSKGRLWVGTALNGLNLFDREAEKFIRFQTESKHSNNISDNRIFSIQEDKQGCIWVGTAHGLNRISTVEKTNYANQSNENREKDITHHYTFSIEHIFLDKANKTNELFTYHDETGNNDYFEPTFFIDSKGIIWVATMNNFFQIKTGNDKSLQIEKLEVNKFMPDSSDFSDIRNHVFNYVEDTTLHVLYLMRKKYITRVDQQTGNIRFLNSEKKDFAYFRSQQIIQSGNIWATGHGGLSVFDLKTLKVWSILPKRNDQLNMINYANNVYKDRTGIIWIGTGGYGILKYNPQTEKFHVVSQPSVIWMSATPDNNVIVQSKKLMLFKKQNTDDSYLPDTGFFQSIYKVALQKTPNVAVQNKEGICWISKSVLLELNTHTNTITEVPGNYTASFPLFVDAEDNLWFGNRAVFCNLDNRTGKIETYQYPVPKISMFPYNFLEAIHQDNKGVFWLGTINGLFRFDKKNKSWKQYLNIANDTTSLSVDIIFSVCADTRYPEKFLWIGTNGGGLNCFDKQTGKFIRFTEKDGLPNKVVYGILNDDDGNLWISTNKGLSRFTPAYSNSTTQNSPSVTGGTFKNFEEENGLQSNEFNRYAFARTKNGTLFFGGVNGFNYFNPKEINDNTVIPNVVITDFKISNQSVSFSKNNGGDKKSFCLTKPIFLTKSITLPYFNNMISFEFSTMDFTAPEKNLFKYKLEGFDKDWIQSGTNHFATYTNLDPGTYTFTVNGSNNDGVWNLIGSSVVLTIRPPWYMTWWFRITVIALVAFMVYAVYRYRLKQALKLLDIRNRIASDLHDEIGSTLSSVYIYSEVAQKTGADKLPEAHIYMKQISVDVANMIDSLGDIVWTVNAKNDRFENIINRMRASAVELFEARNYQLHLEMDEYLNTMKLGMEARKNFYLFYKEAINNVAKYADGKNVFIQLGFNKRCIFLSVKDDGKGFDPDAKKNGNGLSNMKKRATDLKGKFEIISANDKGTEVKLNFPYS